MTPVDRVATGSGRGAKGPPQIDRAAGTARRLPAGRAHRRDDLHLVDDPGQQRQLFGVAVGKVPVPQQFDLRRHRQQGRRALVVSGSPVFVVAIGPGGATLGCSTAPSASAAVRCPCRRSLLVHRVRCWAAGRCWGRRGSRRHRPTRENSGPDTQHDHIVSQTRATTSTRRASTPTRASGSRASTTSARSGRTQYAKAHARWERPTSSSRPRPSRPRIEAGEATSYSSGGAPEGETEGGTADGGSLASDEALQALREKLTGGGA